MSSLGTCANCHLACIPSAAYLYCGYPAVRWQLHCPPDPFAQLADAAGTCALCSLSRRRNVMKQSLCAIRHKAYTQLHFVSCILVVFATMYDMSAQSNDAGTNLRKVQNRSLVLYCSRLVYQSSCKAWLVADTATSKLLSVYAWLQQGVHLSSATYHIS